MQTLSLNIQEPYLSFIFNSQKTIEGRLNKGKFKDLKIGDILLIGPQQNKFVVEKLTPYENFKEMLINEGINKVVPDKNTIEEATDVYYKFFTKEQEKEFGVLAIQIKAV